MNLNEIYFISTYAGLGAAIAATSASFIIPSGYALDMGKKTDPETGEKAYITSYSRENISVNGWKILRDSFAWVSTGAALGGAMGAAVIMESREMQQFRDHSRAECVENAPAGKTVVYTPPGFFMKTDCRYE